MNRAEQAGCRAVLSSGLISIFQQAGSSRAVKVDKAYDLIAAATCGTLSGAALMSHAAHLIRAAEEACRTPCEARTESAPHTIDVEQARHILADLMDGSRQPGSEQHSSHTSPIEWTV